MSGYARFAPVLGFYGKVARFAREGDAVHDIRPGSVFHKQVVVRVRLRQGACSAPPGRLAALSRRDSRRAARNTAERPSCH